MKKIYNRLFIRDKIKITDYCDKNILDKYSDLELAGRYSQNKNNFKIFKKLLKKNNENVNKILMLLVLYLDSTSSIEALKLLLGFGAEINFLDNNGLTPLLAYINNNRFQNIKIIKFFLDNGSNVNFRNNNYHALTMICSLNYTNTEIIELLLKYGADVNMCGINDWPPLFFSVNLLNYNFVKLLIINGANVNYLDNIKNSVLHLSCYNKNGQRNAIVELLIESGTDVNIKNNYDDTALMMIIKYPLNNTDFEIIKLLIRKGSNINYRDSEFMTLMMVCIMSRIWSEYDKYNIIELLLNSKTDVYIKNKKGETILNIIEKTYKKYSEKSYKKYNIYKLIANYKIINNDSFCEFDINFIY